LPLPLGLLWLNLYEWFVNGKTTIEPTTESILGHIFGAFILFVFPLTFGVSAWIYVIQGWPRKGIVAFCNQAPDPDAMMARLEKTWDEGFQTTWNFTVDDEYLIWISKISGGVFPLKDVLWVWTNVVDVPTVPVPAVTFFVVYTADGNAKAFPVRKNDARKIEKHLKENFPDIIVGKHMTMRGYLERRRWAKPEERDVAGAVEFIRKRREERERLGRDFPDAATGEAGAKQELGREKERALRELERENDKTLFELLEKGDREGLSRYLHQRIEENRLMDQLNICQRREEREK